MYGTFVKALIVALGIVSGAAHAQDYPSRPVRIVVPWPAGGPTDILARLIGGVITKRTGQPVIVENKPGAQTLIGMQIVATAPPDGYTLGFNTSQAMSLPATVEKMPFDLVKDFTPIAKVIEGAQFMIISSSVPATNLQEFIAYAKANPGKLNWATSAGPLPQLLFNQAAGVDIPIIPYKGTPELQQAFLSGQVSVIYDNINNISTLVSQGKAVVLASQGQTRQAVLPNVPAFGDVLPKAALNWWMYLYGPAGMPPAVVARLQGFAAEASREADFIARGAAWNGQPVAVPSAVVTKLVADEVNAWVAAAKAAGLPKQ